MLWADTALARMSEVRIVLMYIMLNLGVETESAFGSELLDILRQDRAAKEVIIDPTFASLSRPARGKGGETLMA